MVKTEKYQFNLVEKEDTFSPGPLNENTQKVEAALETKADAAAHAALEQRVQVLELHHIAAGSYTGNGQTSGVTQFIDLGFTPAAIITSNGLSVPGQAGNIRFVDGGFEAYTSSDSGGYVVGSNINGRKYPYLALC